VPNGTRVGSAGFETRIDAVPAHNCSNPFGGSILLFDGALRQKQAKAQAALRPT
jgi:hypothetical protein